MGYKEMTATKYSIGDKVRVKKDLKVGFTDDNLKFTSFMDGMQGGVFKLLNADSNSYKISHNAMVYWLTDAMIEGLWEEPVHDLMWAIKKIDKGLLVKLGSLGPIDKSNIHLLKFEEIKATTWEIYAEPKKETLWTKSANAINIGNSDVEVFYCEDVKEALKEYFQNSDMSIDARNRIFGEELL